MSNSLLGGLGRALATLGLVTALALAFAASPAFAGTPEITKVDPNVFHTEAPPMNGVDVEGSGFESFEVEDIDVGICAFPPIEGVPPCGAFAEEEEKAIDGFGILTANLPVSGAEIQNAHFGVTESQPETFTCTATNCVVAVAYHPPEGGQEILDFEALPFEP